MKPLLMAVTAIGLSIAFTKGTAQTKLPLLKATTTSAVIQDGEYVQLTWKLNPKAKPDVYYVNIPRRNNKVTFKTDKGKLSFKTHYGERYDFVILLNEKDSCFMRIEAKEPRTGISRQMQKPLPDTIPFTLKGSRLYIQGLLNEKENASIQLDLCAGGSCVSKMSSEKLHLSFTDKTILSNTQGINEARLSRNNKLTIGNHNFSNMSIVESGNMQPGEDLIIGNYLFRDKIIEIDYDKQVLIIQEQLPHHVKTFTKQPVKYHGSNPTIKVNFVHNGKKYSHWFGFDTGRDGTMQIGEDFTEQGDNWKNLQELTMINGRKIIRLDATIAGVLFKDIVTNAADPSKPATRRTGTKFGNAALNHFNIILDNTQGYIYLKPNSRTNEPYSSYKDYEKEMMKINQSSKQ